MCRPPVSATVQSIDRVYRQAYSIHLLYLISADLTSSMLACSESVPHAFAAFLQRDCLDEAFYPSFT